MDQPEPLKATAIVHIDMAGEVRKLQCVECSVVDVQVPDSDRVETCLHFTGALIPQSSTQPMTRFDIRRAVIPIRFVTYVGLGPEIRTLSENIAEIPTDRIGLNQEGEATNSISADVIRATLSELRP